MPMNYLTPGVYIEEVPSGAHPIQAVGTSTAAFIGVAPDAKAPRNQPVACNNWTDFVKKFASNESTRKSTPLSHSVFGFFFNGGSRCYVVAIGKDDPLSAGLEPLERYDEVAIVAAPGYNDAGAYQDLLSHCEKMGDRVAIMDGPGPDPVPDINKLIVPAGVGDDKTPKGFGPPRNERGFGAFYYPWITVRDPFLPQDELVNVPPSGHIAGIWAKTDTNPGVHKAPANVLVNGALGLSHELTSQDQGVLNPEGVNVIRNFRSPGGGIKVWGARTVAPGSSEWRYLNVRRLFNMIEESIEESTRWIVFEPNDHSLWRSVKRDVNAFLRRVWRSGALMGRTADEAFFVKCDEETNPPEDVDAGIVTIVIGIAPVKPAEFVVFRISQKQSGAQVEETA